MERKVILSLLFVVLAIFAVIIFWKNTLLLIGSLTILGVIKHGIIPIKSEMVWFVISALLGTIAESTVMLSGPWSYTNVGILNFPVWLPFLWGLAGTVGITLYQGITKSG